MLCDWFYIWRTFRNWLRPDESHYVLGCCHLHCFRPEWTQPDTIKTIITVFGPRSWQVRSEQDVINARPVLLPLCSLCLWAEFTEHGFNGRGVEVVHEDEAVTSEPSKLQAELFLCLELSRRSFGKDYNFLDSLFHRELLVWDDNKSAALLLC